MCFQQDRLAMSTADTLRSVGETDGGSKTATTILIGANLKRLRKRRGFSRRQLAHLAGVETSTLRRLERGAITPSIGMLWKLARKLRVPCTAFIENESHRADVGTFGSRAVWLAIRAAVVSAKWHRRAPGANALR